MNSITITSLDLAITSLLLLFPIVISLLLKLGLVKNLAIASARTVVQLSLLGFVLQWVFTQKETWIVLLLAVSMLFNAILAAVRRSKSRYKGIYLSSFFAMSISSLLSTFVVIFFVLRLPNWSEARYLIPLLGMVLGNTLNGISLALDQSIKVFEDKRDEIEAWLALGATSWEASRPYLKEAIRTGMTPIINSMSIAGLVSLPGMMTGQIMAGAAPKDAVQYQIVIMFMIASATSLGAVIAALLTFKRLTTNSHQVIKI